MSNGDSRDVDRGDSDRENQHANTQVISNSGDPKPSRLGHGPMAAKAAEQFLQGYDSHAVQVHAAGTITQEIRVRPMLEVLSLAQRDVISTRYVKNVELNKVKLHEGLELPTKMNTELDLSRLCEVLKRVLCLNEKHYKLDKISMVMEGLFEYLRKKRV